MKTKKDRAASRERRRSDRAVLLRLVQVGMPSKQAFIPFSHIVSPIEKMPGSNTPMMSPA